MQSLVNGIEALTTELKQTKQTVASLSQKHETYLTSNESSAFGNKFDDY